MKLFTALKYQKFPLGCTWLAFEAIEHWRFAGDDDFARDTALPILRDAITFIWGYATEYDDYYTISPG